MDAMDAINIVWRLECALFQSDIPFYGCSTLFGTQIDIPDIVPTNADAGNDASLASSDLAPSG